MRLKIRMLTRAEEQRLMRLALAGDDSARNKIVEGMYPFILKEAGRIANRYDVPSDVEDLAQAGIEKIIIQFSKFDPESGCRALTYFGIAARREMITRATSLRLIRTPNNVPSEKNAEHVARARSIISLESETAKHTSVGDLVPSKGVSPDEQAITDEVEASRDERIGALRRCIESLPTRMRIVMQRRLAGDTLLRIGGALGVSKERARQLHLEAKSLVRERMLLWAMSNRRAV